MSKNTQASKTYIRFDLVQRIQHIIFLISFTLLGFTGLPQKYPLSPISLGIFDLVGGVEAARVIHHVSAIVMMIVSVFHVLELLYRIIVERTPISMIPWVTDLIHVYEDVLYYLGFRKHKAYYGRYSYAEKAEYLALIWGTIVMGLTGFMMWNPISTLRFLPGESIPAAKAAHGGEAVLAVLAIIIWHFYHVHIKHLNKSMFTGKLTHEEMQHEHPAELAHLEKEVERPAIPPAVLRKRQYVFAPIAAVVLIAFIVGFYFFVGYETTAITAPMLHSTVTAYVPQTATPMPTSTSTPVPTATLTPTATLVPTATAAVTEASGQATDTPPASSSSPTWTSAIGPLFAEKCQMCHGTMVSGGLNLATYADAMKGGASGPTFLPGDSANSYIVLLFQGTTHTLATLTPEELALIIAWLDAGAPE